MIHSISLSNISTCSSGTRYCRRMVESPVAAFLPLVARHTLQAPPRSTGGAKVERRLRREPLKKKASFFSLFGKLYDVSPESFT